MRSSRAAAPWGAAAALAALLAALASSGCAHAPRGTSDAPPEEAVPDPEVSRDEAPPPPVPAASDPSEEITPEELSTIPEPVPSGEGGRVAPGARETPPEGTEAPERGAGTSNGDSRAAAPSETVWRVQIFATEELSEAGRVARRAAALLGTSASVHFERPLYKVRLGAFRSEAEAQSLRERAAAAGYPGAFRIRTPPG